MDTKDMKLGSTGGDVVTTFPEAPIGEALSLMARLGIHHLPVMENDECVGMLSYRDVLKASAVAKDFSEVLHWQVGRVMREEVPAIGETTEVRDVLKVMRETGVSALPVVREGKVVGIVTESDMLKAIEVFLAPSDGVSGVVNRGEGLLANPMVQNVLKLLSDMGI